MPTIAERLRGLAHPRSRRTRLWACVYCRATGTSPDAADSAASRSAD